jgi:outer membrane receptor protein involved in Fe transport
MSNRIQPHQAAPRLRPLSIALHLALLAAPLLPMAAMAQDAPAAAAQDTPTTLDTIVVTAQKREQQVQDVPIAISAYSGEFLQATGIDGFEQLGNYVPGLQIQVQSPNNPGFVIRGITSDDGSSQMAPRVSVFQDGVSISRARGAVVELFDMERVEVLRGPQGTLFGRGAQTGAVHLIQNKAVDAREGGFRAGFGNYGETYFTGFVNAPLADKVYGRLAVFHQQRDGYIDNLAGGDLNGKDTFAVRGSLGFDIGDGGSRLDLIVNHQKDTPPGTAFRATGYYAADAALRNSPLAYNFALPTRAGSTDLFDRTADLNRGEDLGVDRTVSSVSLLGTFNLNDDWTMSTITGWREFDSREEADGDGTQLYLIEFTEIAKGKQYSQEIRFNYDGGGAFRGFLGGSWFKEDGSTSVPLRSDERSLYAVLAPLLAPSINQGICTANGGTWSNGGIPIAGACNIPTPPLPRVPGQLPIGPFPGSYLNPLNPDGTPNTGYNLGGLPGLPNPGVPGLPAFFALNPNQVEQYTNYGEAQAIELFADGTWSATDRLDLTLGLRWTHEKLTSGYQSEHFGTPSWLGFALGGFPNVLFTPTARTNASETYNSVVGRAVASYKFSDDINGYASYSRGRRPDVLQMDGPGPAEHVPAEIVDSYELGLKGSAAGGRLVYDLAAYYYKYENFQTAKLSILPTTENAGNAHSKGVEASLIGRFSDHLTGFVNLGWSRARFDDEDSNGVAQAYAGNHFRLNPDHTAAVGLDWRVPFGGGHEFFFRPNYTYRSHVYFEDRNDDDGFPLEQDGYGLVNLNLGVKLANGWEVQAWGSNLADEDYLIDAGNTGLQLGIPTYIVGPPRMFGLRVAYQFGGK